MKKLNITGQKFNRLTCLNFVGMNHHKKSVFQFLCDCGNQINAVASGVKNGHTISCGCYRKEQVSKVDKKLDIVGKKFGKLLCIKFVKADIHKRSVFQFLCDCGNYINAVGSLVKNGETNSCGCLHKELISLLGSTTGINNNKSANKGWTYGTVRMRSGYEIFYAYYLDQCKIEWEYEPETFKLDNGLRYTPDFYLPESDTWVEIKGKMTDENRRKISLFRIQTENKLKVLFIKDLEKLAGQSYQSFMKENKEYYL